MSPVGQSNWLIFFIHNSLRTHFHSSHAPIGLFHHSAASSCPSCVLVWVLTRDRVSGACFRSVFQEQAPSCVPALSHGEDCWIQTLEIDGVRKQLSRPGMSVVNFVVKPARLNFTCHMIKKRSFISFFQPLKSVRLLLCA